MEQQGRQDNRALSGTPGTFWCNLRESGAKKREEKKVPSLATRAAYGKLEDVIGCKWSVSVLMAVREGISRPGALERHITGISTKVLSERLRKLTRYGLLDKRVFAEVPPRTEYALTTAGRELAAIIAQIHRLEERLRRGEPFSG